MTERIREVGGPGDLRRLHRENPSRYPFLLQSTSRANGLGRYDILFAFPGSRIVADDGKLFLDRLDEQWQEERLSPVDSNMPFHGGWFLYLGYELAGEIEPALDLAQDPLLPRAFAVRCPVAVIYDHDTGDSFLVNESPGNDARELILDDIASSPTADSEQISGQVDVVEEDPEIFMRAVEQARDYIAAGDVYQANLSRPWTATGRRDADDIYAALCDANPGPFAGMARWDDIEIMSSSPERLLRIRGEEASTRPIAGTRPRSEDALTDSDLSTELFANAKERAEHVMLIDLERNDLGRICEAGSVVVDEMMVLESYAHVHHIVSNVSGRLRDDVTPGKAIAAVFPGGTITGCPKVRCMEIISELEQGPRGAYTGSFGYLNRDGSLDLNILIRTIVRTDDGVTFRAGSGIVADSSAPAELQETRAKAEGMLRAIVQ